MQKLIDNYSDATFVQTFRNQYIKYRAGHPKHRYYLLNRHKDDAVLDLYDQYILENLKSGKTMAYDISGYYLEDFVDDLVVVEETPLVLTWAPSCVLTTDSVAMDSLIGNIDNLIMLNPKDLRWTSIDQWTEWWLEKAQYLKSNAQIFFSFRENRLLRNRLKVKFSTLMATWLQTMKAHGFKLKYYDYEACQVNDSIINYKQVPEISDPVNGNLKIHWEYHG